MAAAYSNGLTARAKNNEPASQPASSASWPVTDKGKRGLNVVEEILCLAHNACACLSFGMGSGTLYQQQKYTRAYSCLRSIDLCVPVCVAVHHLSLFEENVSFNFPFHSSA